MLLTELIQSFREYADDLVTPYLWSDALVESYADEAEIEACSRRPLLTTSDSFEENLCSIDVSANEAVYTKHSAMREVNYANFVTASDTYKLYVTNIDELVSLDPYWYLLTGTPEYLLLADNTVQLVPVPDVSGTIAMNVSHVPLTKMSEKEAPDTLGPTIDEAHHYKLVYWMLHLAFDRLDADAHNVERSIYYANKFAEYFGDQRDVNAMRTVRNVRAERMQSGWI